MEILLLLSGLALVVKLLLDRRSKPEDIPGPPGTDAPAPNTHEPPAPDVRPDTPKENGNTGCLVFLIVLGLLFVIGWIGSSCSKMRFGG